MCCRTYLLALMLLVSGFAVGASLRSDLDACRGDAACVAHMEQSRQVAVAATKAATSDGFIPTAVGYLVSLTVGVFGGHKLSKKQVV